MLNKGSKIFVAGHHGLVGSAIWNNLKARGYNNLIGKSHKELDLTDQYQVRKFFDEEMPDAVVLAAAHVGGIMANSLYRADFMMENMKIQCNVIGEAYRHGVEKLLFLGSTCIYPRDAEQPMKEDCLLTSLLEYTNEEYALAKISGLKMCESYNLQYGTNYIAVMPTNLYGPNDNFHLENSHVMPAMMRKVYLAKLLNDNNWEAIRKDLEKRPVPCDSVAGKIANAESTEPDILAALAHYGIEPNRVTLWGTGKPLREFLWSEEMADASVHVLLNVNFSDIIGMKRYSSAQDENGNLLPEYDIRAQLNRSDNVDNLDNVENFEKSRKRLNNIDRNKSHGRGGAIPQLGEIRNCHINVGTGKELTIRELSELVVKAVGFEGEVFFDASKPDGTMRKLIDVSKLHRLGWHHKIEIDEGVQRLFDWYKSTL